MTGNPIALSQAETCQCSGGLYSQPLGARNVVSDCLEVDAPRLLFPFQATVSVDKLAVGQELPFNKTWYRVESPLDYMSHLSLPHPHFSSKLGQTETVGFQTLWPPVRSPNFALEGCIRFRMHESSTDTDDGHQAAMQGASWQLLAQGGAHCIFQRSDLLVGL